MSGFVTQGRNQPCLMLLHSSAVLSSPALFAAGCVGVFALGVLAEFLLAFRRRFNDRSAYEGGKSRRRVAASPDEGMNFWLFITQDDELKHF